MLKRLWNGLTRNDKPAPSTARKVPSSAKNEPVKPRLAASNPAANTIPVAPVAPVTPVTPEAVPLKTAEEPVEETVEVEAPQEESCSSSLAVPDCGMIVELEIAPGEDGIDSRTSVELLASFHNDLEHDRFRLSSLPDTAMRIRQLLNDPDLQVSKLAEVIGLDAAIAAKLIRVSNSALYTSTSRSDTIQGAVLRLGLDMTRQIVMSFALKDLLDQCPGPLKGLIDQYWEHSVRVSSIAYVLAKRSRICAPEEALLAGILSNVGVFSIFNYLGNYPDICEDADRMEASVRGLQAEVGAMVLEKWEFSAELADCARHCEDWNRHLENDNDCADLCDLVIVAAMHAYIGQRRLPPFEKIPSFVRFSGGNLSAESAVEFMRDAQAEIEQTRTLFYGA